MNEVDEDPDRRKTRDVSPDEMRATYAVPTITVNRFVVSTNPAQVRIAFGETLYVEDQINWRVALSLSPYEAIELKAALSKLLAPFEEQYNQGTPNDGAPSE